MRANMLFKKRKQIVTKFAPLDTVTMLRNALGNWLIAITPPVTLLMTHSCNISPVCIFHLNIPIFF